MITAIVLAAGESRRMGRQKLLLPYVGGTVVEYIVRQLQVCAVSDIIVVTGKDREGVEAVLASSPVSFAFNAGYAQGMLSSVRRGIQAAPRDTDGYLIVLGDQPSLRTAVVNSIIAAFRENRSAGIVVPIHQGRRGHPVLFSSTYREEVLSGLDDTGLRGLLGAHPEAVVEVSVDSDAVLRDMDYPEDYQRELDAL